MKKIATFFILYFIEAINVHGQSNRIAQIDSILSEMTRQDLFSGDDFPKFFRQHFTDQLIADQLITPLTQSLLDSADESIVLQPTDNDKRVIGFMNDCIFRIRIYNDRKEDTIPWSPTYIGHELNRTPMGAIGYKYPVEKMKEFLEKQIF